MNEPEKELTADEYREMVIQTTAKMLGILAVEMPNVEDPLQLAYMTICSDVLAQLQMMARAREEERLVIPPTKLILPNGNLGHSYD